MPEKQKMRDAFTVKKTEMPKPSCGKLAEQVRRLAGYREAHCIFAGPDPMLEQVRINALGDGKTLIMPGPSLREGFYLIKPYSVPFKDLKHAVTYKGLVQHGKHLLVEDIAGLAIDLFFTEILCVDPNGVFIGNGYGFFDLGVALLAEFGGVAENAQVYGVGVGEQLLDDELVRDGWDVAVNGLVTVDGVTQLGQGRIETTVDWEALPERRIKKIAPLWKLACKEGKI